MDRTLTALGRRIHARTGKARLRRGVALTFDDGPHPEFTPRIVDALTALRLPATFFVVGTQAEQHPDLIRLLQERGLSIGLHGHRHYLPRHLPTLPPDWLEREIDEGLAALDALGVRANLFRPPMGKVSEPGLAHARARGLVTVLWDVDPRDWEPGVTREGLANAVITRSRPGSIVLLHDGGPHREATAEALPLIDEGLRRARLRPVGLHA